MQKSRKINTQDNRGKGSHEERSVHHLQCPDCGEWFDMRDLTAVMTHQHWMEQPPPAVTFSHVRQKGNERDIFVKGARDMITLRMNSNRPHPPHRA